MKIWTDNEWIMRLVYQLISAHCPIIPSLLLSHLYLLSPLITVTFCCRDVESYPVLMIIVKNLALTRSVDVQFSAFLNYRDILIYGWTKRQVFVIHFLDDIGGFFVSSEWMWQRLMMMWHPVGSKWHIYPTVTVCRHKCVAAVAKPNYIVYMK